MVDVPLGETALQNLANLDIEAVFPMYTDNLKDFFDKAKAKTKEFQTELDGIDHFIPPQPSKKYSEMEPTGGGWVVELRGYTYNKKQREFVIDTLVYNIDKLGFGKELVPFGAVTPPPTSGAANASNTFPDPIDGRISHAFLYFCRKVLDPQPGVFTEINSSPLRDLIGGGSGSGGVGGPPPGMAGAGVGTAGAPGMPGAGGGASGADSRSAWQPLGSAAGGGNSAGSGAGGTAPGTGGAGAAPAAVGAKNRIRYEFIVYFIWREPTMDPPAAK